MIRVSYGTGREPIQTNHKTVEAILGDTQVRLALGFGDGCEAWMNNQRVTGALPDGSSITIVAKSQAKG